MMPKNTPVHVPPALLGEAGPDTLADLVRDSRRLGRHWPPLATSPDDSPAHRAIRVPKRSAALVEGMSDYGD